MELLIRVTDKGPDIDHSKAGHVISIQPDGWQWGSMEKSNPDWIIVTCPDLLQIESEMLLSVPYIETNEPQARRLFSLDAARLTNGQTIDRVALMALVK